MRAGEKMAGERRIDSLPRLLYRGSCNTPHDGDTDMSKPTDGDKIAAATLAAAAFGLRGQDQNNTTHLTKLFEHFLQLVSQK